MAILLSFPASTSAQVADEVSDAGDTAETAQDLSATAVTTINGSIQVAGDADVYRIYIGDTSTFSATTYPGVTGGLSDTRLFLFDSDGIGICYDDDTFSSNRPLMSTIEAGEPNCVYSGFGYYYIAVTHYNVMAENADGVNLFCESDNDDPGPGSCDTFHDTLPVATPDPLAQWNASGDLLDRTGAYAIQITGTVPSASEPDALPAGYAFDLLGSNPFAERTQFDLRVAVSQDVRVVAYDMIGREAAVLYAGPVSSGMPRTVTFDRGDLRAGTYLVRAMGDAFDVVQPVTLLR